MENQSVGLASALGGTEVVIQRLHLCTPWKQLAPYLPAWLPIGLTPASDKLEAPWPDVIFACGRRMLLVGRWLRRRTRGRSRLVALQKPPLPASWFDAVVCPLHDRLTGPNVVTMIGSPTPLTTAMIDEHAKQHGASWHEPSPRIGVLLGGNNKVYRLLLESIETWAKQWDRLLKTTGGALWITTSRRTPPEVVAWLREHYDGVERVRLWTGTEGPNPYRDLLAWSECLLVSCESVNMVMEACVTRASVRLLPLHGDGGKFSDFHASLERSNRLRWWDGMLPERVPVEPLEETKRAAQALEKLLWPM